MAPVARRRADYLLLSYFTVLLLFGLMMLISASAAVAQAHWQDNYFFVKRQLLFGVMPGLAAFFITAKLPYEALKRLSLWAWLVSLLLLVLVLVPGIGSKIGTNARSWILLFGYSFQPSELVKIALIMFMARYLSKKGKRLTALKSGFLPALLVGMLPIVMVGFQPDIGTVIILFSILFAMLFLAEARLSHLITLAAIGLAALAFMTIIAPYRVARLTTFLHPELDPRGIGYQINQGFLAIGSGGIWGLGFGQSRQKYQYLPEVQSDSIFAIIAEEMGLIFAAGIVVLFLLISYRSFMIAKYASDQYGRLLSGGIITWFMVQAFLNIGAMVGVVPLTGVPLPFISHGGTALLVEMAAVGMVVSVSKHTE